MEIKGAREKREREERGGRKKRREERGNEECFFEIFFNFFLEQLTTMKEFLNFDGTG